MPKDSSAKYYQDDQERLQKRKPREWYRILSKEEKEKKSENMVVKDIKIYRKMKNKSLLSIEKIITKWEKMPYYNHKKLISFKTFGFFLGSG